MAGVSGPTYKIIDGSFSTGSGDVSGPGSSVNNAIALFNGTDGDTLKTSNIVVDGSDNVSGMGTLGCGEITAADISVSGGTGAANTMFVDTNVLGIRGGSSGTEIQVSNGNSAITIADSRAVTMALTLAVNGGSISCSGNSNASLNVTSNSVSTGFARITASVGASSTGNAFSRYLLNASGLQWSAGIYNADDSYRIANASDIGSSDKLTINTSGDLGVANKVGRVTGSTGTLELNGDAIAFPTSGGRVVLYGSSHATRANDWALLAGTDEVLAYDDSADRLVYGALTQSPDTTAPTLANLPTGGTAAQVGWIELDIGGTASYVPYWQ